MKNRNTVPAMILVIFLTSMAAAFLSALLYNRTKHNVPYYLLILSGSIAAHFLIMFLSAPVVALLFRKNFHYRGFWFQQRAFEKKLYEKLNIKRWKSKLPAYDSREFSREHNTLEGIIQNMCHAEVVHEVIFLASYLPVLLGKLLGNYGLLLALSFAFSCVHLIFIMIQRYNRPRVIRIYEKMG